MKLQLVSYAPCTMRDAVASDKGFIMHSWMSRHMTSPTHRAVPKDVYYYNQEIIIKSLLKQSVVLVACSPEDCDQIFGYIVAQPTPSRTCLLHWIQVKQSFRRLGIGTALLHEAIRATDSDKTGPVVATHISDCFGWLSAKWNVIYNPYLIHVEIKDI